MLFMHAFLSLLDRDSNIGMRAYPMFDIGPGYVNGLNPLLRSVYHKYST